MESNAGRVKALEISPCNIICICCCTVSTKRRPHHSHLDTEQSYVADNGVEIHEDVLHHDVDVGARTLDDVLVVDPGEDGAEHLDEDEDAAEAELEHGAAAVHGARAGVRPRAARVNHAARREYQQGDPLDTAQLLPEQYLQLDTLTFIVLIHKYYSLLYLIALYLRLELHYFLSIQVS